MSWEINPYTRIKFNTLRFERLLEAQGWNVKWEIASRCACWLKEYGEPNINCPVCHGRGYFYTKPSIAKMYEEQVQVLSNNQIRLKLHTPSKILRVYNKALNVDYTVSSMNGKDITLVENNLLMHYGVFVDYEYSLIHTITEVKHVTGLIKDELFVSKGPIASIIAINNLTQGTVSTSLYSTDNMIKLSAPVEPTDNIQIQYTYIEPIRMILTEAKENKEFKPIGEILDGDVSVTFMPWFDIGDRDRLTILSNNVTTRYSEMLKMGVIDTLKMDTIIKILEIRDLDRVYIENVDWKFDGTHKIAWIDTGVRPIFGTQYSVTYIAHREYIVWQEQWQERFHGDILLPRRLVARKLEKYNFYRDATYDSK